VTSDDNAERRAATGAAQNDCPPSRCCELAADPDGIRNELHCTERVLLMLVYCLLALDVHDRHV
jgi:hypothetical protein